MKKNDTASLSSDLQNVAPTLKVAPPGAVMSESLKRGSVDAVMQLIKSLDARGVATALGDAGFSVSPSAVSLGRAAVFSSVKDDLNEALSLRVNGFGLRHARGLANAVELAASPFAAKVGVSGDSPALSAEDFKGDVDAARVIQSVLRAKAVAVDLMGDALPNDRGSLQMIAAQGLKKGIQGFGFDGMSGKYEVNFGMPELLELHRCAAQAVTKQTVLSNLGVWAAGGKVKELDDWVPDSIQRLLHGSVTLESAQAVVQAVENGSVDRHSAQIGVHGCTSLLAGQGLDVNAKTLAQSAIESGWVLQVPDRIRGQYFGQLVATDHRAGLVKYTRVDVIELPFNELGETQSLPKIGDMVRIDFKQGALTMNVIPRHGHEKSGR